MQERAAGDASAESVTPESTWRQADGFERLWTPHRMAYIQDDERRGGDQDPHEKPCPFCSAPKLDDQEALIVYRGETSFVILNLFPYNPGHLLICPHRHVADYTDLTDDETLEIAHLTQQSIRVLRAVSHAAGMNLGMNQGSVAGAGIAAHLHQHVVPRYSGDANFLPIIAQTKALPELLSQTRDKLADAWKTYAN